jgi:prephenate dehydrogenase
MIVHNREYRMTIQLLIIGLGQIGTSIGLALADQKNKIRCVGYDADLAVAHQSERMKAVEKLAGNLPKTAANSDLILLAMPVSGMREILEIIAPVLKEGAVVMDVSPAKEAMIAWTQELLPAGRYYVGLCPAINPDYLEARGLSLKAANADLFRKGLVGIVTPPGSPPAAIRLATDLVSLLGAEHLFFDAVEVDSLMAAVHLLPQLAGAALLDATINQSGWREGRKLAGRPYADVTGAFLHSGGAENLAHAAVLSGKHAVRVLDNLIASLQDLRAEIEEGKADVLLEHLNQAYEDRLTWWMERQKGGWLTDQMAAHAELPTGGQMLGRMIGLGPKPKK